MPSLPVTTAVLIKKGTARVDCRATTTMVSSNGPKTISLEEEIKKQVS